VTPDEFKEARRRLGLTQAQLGAILDTNPTTIRRWEMAGDARSARPPNPVAAQVMRWMLSGFRPPEWPGSRT
jgi:DNA-binding transcriptional regulator YiaG